MAFDNEQCDWIINYVKAKGFVPEKGRVGGSEKDSKAIEEIRNVDTYPVPYDEFTAPLYHKLTMVAGAANQMYNFDVFGQLAPFQLLHYKPGGHYKWHIDIGGDNTYGRKISMIVQLSDPSEYEGGEVLINNGNEYQFPNEKGSVITFPSYALHKVCPVTKGERWALVAWIQGKDNFK